MCPYSVLPYSPRVRTIQVMEPPSSYEALRELHSDLSRKYKIHKTAIERIWRSLDGPQRAKCFKAGAADGVVLQHPADTSMGNVYKIMPEMNLRDIAKPGSDFLLRLLKHRATLPLSEQYCTGVDGDLGDHGLIAKMMTEKGLRHVDDYKDCYTMFYDDKIYGESVKLVSHRAESLAGLAPAIRAQVVVPQSMGELILQRQIYIIQGLNIFIEDILEAGSENRNQRPAPKKPANPASQALPRLTSIKGQPKPTILDISTNANEQRLSLEDYLDLMLTEPLVLTQVVNIRFFSQPELVADEKGRRLPVHTDKHISPVLYEAMQDAIRGVSIWSYINFLLKHLQNPVLDKAYRMIVQQELVNAYHIEYARSQSNLKRFVQIDSGNKWFKRISNARGKTGDARVTLKGNVQDLFGVDTQLYYILRLCQPETSPAKAIEWIGKLSDLHRNHPDEQEKLGSTETDALGDLAVILAFIQDVTSMTSLPPFSRKTGQILADNLQKLDLQVTQLQANVDLGDFVIPIDHLLEDGMASGALTAMDEYLCNTLGTTMRAAYQNMISECTAELAKRYQQVKARIDQNDAKPPPFSSTTELATPPTQPRHVKEKTRGVEPAMVMYTTDASTPMAINDDAHPPTLQVNSTIARVFRTIFRKSEARGSVTWDAFEAAMASLGFSVIPKCGSIFTFLPPSTMSVKKSITIHRPHKSQIEGYRLLLIGKRLGRIYGWNDETFQEA
ncbi:hypothetical protein CDD82_4509 [Ophiocordyceps australis]|uniref:Ipa protein n=1 Tax=Ophiocordyceps australis TaxID=1399860 RepID=A0A2C5ZU51_9HYPO|nr:hypothetical protein CDD82_4509 [Ophiocordyceps australis]